MVRPEYLRTARIVDPPSVKTKELSLVLSLLGPFEASADDQPLSFATDAARALLAYLAVEGGRPHRREQLATMLWPDKSQSAALTNLRQTLARLRKGLSEPLAAGVLEITHQTLEVKPDGVDLDCTRFDSLIAACASHAHSDLTRCRICIQRLERACKLYRGEFLDGVFPGGAHLFDEWALSKREQLHRQALDVLHTLARHYESIADYEAMRRYGARQLRLEPWREDAHRQVMRALALQGARTAALEQYETCRRILAAELGIEPDTETRALYERIRDDAPAPEALQAPVPAYNLPAQLTPFVGREQELATINALLDDPDMRLLTLVGAGGMGKTRLALETTYQRLNRYPDGVFFVSLASVARPDAIASAIAMAMGLELTGDIRQALPFALRDKQTLLVLDNFEHLLDGVGIVVELLEAAPNLQLLATSRERLEVLAEHVYMVLGMDYSPQDSQGATQAAAIRLFAQSARRVQPDFALGDEDLTAVACICALVDGMPLGLELAAAWADMLPLDEIAREIERNADFLSTGLRDIPERHRSLRAVFDGSWRSLDESEQKMFRQLSVFQGGFTRGAADAIAGTSLRALARLARKSLLHQHGGRYQIHELLRQFGAEQLDKLPDERAAVVERHCVYYLTLVAQRQRALDDREPQLAAKEIRSEIDNIEKAWMSAVQHGRRAELDQSAIALWRFCSLTGSGIDLEQFTRLAADRLETDLGQCDTDLGADAQRHERLLGKLRAIQAAALVSQGKHDSAIPVAEKAIALGQVSQGIEGEAFGYLSKGQALAQKAQYAEAQHCLENALHLARHALSDDAVIDSLEIIEYLVSLWLGAIANRRNEYARAKQLFGQSLATCQRRGDLRGEMHSLANLAIAARTTHEYAVARENYEHALRLARQLGYRWGEATTQQELGDLARLQGDPELARKLAVQSLVLFREIGDRLRESVSLAYLGRLHTYLGDDTGSHEYIDQFLNIIEGLNAPFAENWGWLALAIRHNYVGDWERALDYAQRAVAAAQSVGSRVDHADALVVTGQILARMNRPAEARCAYQRAVLLCDDVNWASEVISARAGLAFVALIGNDWPEALTHIETILATFARYPGARSDQPFVAYLTCYRVLDAVDDLRAASVLNDAHRQLLEYADGIKNAALRRSFLENVTAHRELQEAYADRFKTSLASR